MRRRRLLPKFVLHFRFPAILLLLLLLKVAEVCCEPHPWFGVRVRSSDWGPLEILGFGIFRRLDDVTFWIVVALWLADRRIRFARRALPKDYSVSRPFVCCCMVVLWGTLLVGAYVGAAYATGQTFGWKSKWQPLTLGPYRYAIWNEAVRQNWDKWIRWRSDYQPPWTPRNEEYVRVIQIEEGVVMCLAILSATYSIATGLNIIQYLRGELRHGTLTPKTEIATSALLQACLMPFLAVSLFRFAVAIIVEQLKLTESGVEASATDYATAIGTIIVYSTPYVLLALLARVVLWKHGVAVQTPILNKTVAWIDVQVGSQSAQQQTPSTDKSG